MAALAGKDVKKLKAKGGGKWKYMSEKEMVEHSAKFAPYRLVVSFNGPSCHESLTASRSLFMWYMWRISDEPESAPPI